MVQPDMAVAKLSYIIIQLSCDKIFGNMCLSSQCPILGNTPPQTSISFFQELSIDSSPVHLDPLDPVGVIFFKNAKKYKC